MALFSTTNICRNCVSEIKRQSQTIKSISKQSYPIEEGYEFIYEKYGPAIKHTLEDGTVEYITANKDVNLEKIQRGEYSLNELIEVKDNFQEQEISIYKGWMISSSPDVTPLEHPIYDLWLLGCSNDKKYYKKS